MFTSKGLICFNVLNICRMALAVMELAILSVELAAPAEGAAIAAPGDSAPPKPAARVQVQPRPADRHRPKYCGNVQSLLAAALGSCGGLSGKRTCGIASRTREPAPPPKRAVDNQNRDGFPHWRDCARARPDPSPRMPAPRRRLARRFDRPGPPH